jgi:hypothetical protein
MKKSLLCFSIILTSLFSSFAQENQYFEFDGFDDYAKIERYILPQDTDFTVEMFYNICAANQDFVFFDNRRDTNGMGMRLFTVGQDSVVLAVQSDTGTSSLVIAGKKCSPGWGELGHIAVTRSYSDSMFAVYINGNKEIELKSAYKDSRAFYLGKSIDSWGNPFVGWIDEVRLSNVRRYTTNFQVNFDFFIADNSTLAYWNADGFAGDTIFYDLSNFGNDLIGKNGIIVQERVDSSQDYGLCLGSSIEFNAGGGSTFSWSPSDHLSSTSTRNPLCDSDTAIKYTVVVGHNNGCKNDTSKISVTINGLPDVTVNPMDTLICEGDTAWFTAAGAQFYNWHPNALFFQPFESSTGAAPNDTASAFVIGRDINFCADTVYLNIYVEDCSKGVVSIPSQEFEVYPNPTSNTLHFDLPFDNNASIMVYDALGKAWNCELVTGGIDVSDLMPGHYFILIESKERLYRSQFLKQ